MFGCVNVVVDEVGLEEVKRDWRWIGVLIINVGIVNLWFWGWFFVWLSIFWGFVGCVWVWLRVDGWCFLRCVGVFNFVFFMVVKYLIDNDVRYLLYWLWGRCVLLGEEGSIEEWVIW